MTRKQWLGLSGLLLALVGVVVFVAVGGKDKADVVLDVLEKEKEETRESVTKDLRGLLGIDYDVLTRDKMLEVIEEWERDEGLLDDYVIRDRLAEEYGAINGLAFEYGYLVNDGDEYSVVLSVANSLAEVARLGYFLEDDEGVGMLVEKTRVIPTLNVMYYHNPIRDLSEFEYRPNRVIRSNDEGIIFRDNLYVSDTNGFKEVGGLLVGYPRVLASSMYEKYMEYGIGGDDLRRIGLEIDILLTEEVGFDDLIKKVRKLDLELNGEKVYERGNGLKDEYIEELIEHIGSEYGIEVPSKEERKIAKDYGGLLHHVTDDVGWGVSRGEDIVEESKKSLNKKFLEGSIVSVKYEFPLDILQLEGIDSVTSLTEYAEGLGDDRYMELKVNGEVMKLEFLTEEIENRGIYYKE